MSEDRQKRIFTFIDLFAGIGGFHLAMQKLGGKCVFASELKEDLQELYKKNFGMTCTGDINQVNINSEIPNNFDMLCAGFPCQPFSKAGKQQGFKDQKDRGNLFWTIMEILKAKKPEYILLENVPNLKSHDNGNTWAVIKEHLETLYDVKCDIISPHNFGIPQHRKRFYIVGRLKDKGGLKDFCFPPHDKKYECNIKTIIQENDTDYMTLRPQTRRHLEVWQNFLDLLTKNNIPIPSFPIWAMEWGADYEYTDIAPFYQDEEKLKKYHGKFGELAHGNCKDDYLQCLPIYAQTNKTEANHHFPDWKISYIKSNRMFYNKYRNILKPWIEQLKEDGFENSHQKLEWNCSSDKNVKPILWDKIIQFRASGIRVKLPTYSPALVLTTTQIPIFPWITTPNGEQGRYMTRKEAALLQKMDDLKSYPDTIAEAFRAFGNAVNVEVVRLIAASLLKENIGDVL